MYTYELIIKMSDGREFSKEISRKNEDLRLSEDEKKIHINRMFHSDFIELYKDNDYLILNTRLISSISIREHVAFRLPK